MATTIDNLVVKVSSDGISRTTRELDNLGNAAEKTEKKVNSLVANVDKMVKAFQTGAGSTRAMVEALNAVNRQSQASDSVIKALLQSVQNLTSQIGALSTQIRNGGSVIQQNTVHIRHHAQAMSDAHAAARGLTGSLGALWLTYGNLAPLAAGAAIGASFKSIITIGAEVENTLEAIRLKTGATTEDMKLLTQTVSDMGKSVYGPQEVVKALEALSLAGLNAKQAAEAVGAALNLATSGGTSIEKSAETLVTIGTAVGATSREYDYLADAIQKTANISLASVDSISESVKRASVVNKLYGASFEDILTQTAALAQLGIKNSAAGTAITNFYANAMGGTDKAKKALDELGFSFQDVTGKAKAIVPAFEEFVQKLNEFDTLSQKKIIMDIFGERALRDVEALRDLTLQTVDGISGLAEIQNKIKNSAGASALIAAEMAMTTENVFKSTINTMKSAFGDAFKVIQPQVDNILRKLRELFDSQEFSKVITNLAKAFVSLSEAIVENIKPLTAMAEAFLVVGTITAGGALFSKLIPIVNGLAVAFGAVAVAANGAAVATGAFGTAIRFLPGLGMVVGALTAAWALYSVHSEAAAKSTREVAEETRKAAEQYAGDYVKSLDEQIDRLKKVNAALDEGKTLQEANTQAAAEAAVQKLRAKFIEAETAALGDLMGAEAKLARMRKDFGFDYTKQGLIKDQMKAVEAAQENLNRAKRETLAIDEQLRKKAQEVVDLTQAQSDKLNARTADADAKAQAAAGTKTFTGEDTNKGENFFESLAASNNKWIAGHKARIEMLQEEGRVGKMVAGEVAFQEALAVLNSEAAIKASQGLTATKLKEYQMTVLQTALQKDETKFIEDKAKVVNEFSNKLGKIQQGEIQYQEDVTKGRNKNIGTLEREADAIAFMVSLTTEEAETLRVKARAMDEVNKAIDSRNKLERALGSAEQRADTALEEAKAIEMYGEKAKIGAIAAAELYLEKLKLNSAADESLKTAYMEVAALEQVSVAYRNLARQSESLEKELEKARAEGMMVFVEREEEKIRIRAQTLKKQALMEVEAARAAADASPFNPEVQARALAAEGSYLRAIEQINEISNEKINTAKLLDSKKTVDKIVEETLRGFDNILDKGVSVWKTLTNSIKSMFKSTVLEYLKKEFAKPLVLNVVANVAGGMGMTGIANAAQSMLGTGGGSSGGSGGLSALSSAANIYKLLSGGFENIATSVANVVQSGLYGTGLSSNILSNGAFATGVGSLASIGTGALAGNSIGKAISGGFGSNSTVNAGTGIGAVIGSIVPGIGTAIGSALGGVLGGVVNRLFGRGPKEVQSQGIRGSLSESMVTGEGYSNWKQKGGLFRSSKSGTDKSQLGDDLQNTLLSGFVALKTASGAFAKNLGIGETALNGFTKSFDIAFGTDNQKNQEAVTKFFTDLGDEFATKLIPNISEFSRQGETASQTLERLSNVFQATDQVAAILGRSVEQAFGSVGLSSDTARERLVDFAGGLDSLVNKTAAYASSFLTDAEKLAPVQKALLEEMKKLGLEGVKTKDQFKAIVNGLDLTTVSGAKLFNELLNLAPAFAQVADAATKAAEEAAQAAKDAAEKAAKERQDAIDNAIKGAEDAFGVLKRSVDAEKKVLKANYDMRVSFIKAEGEARKRAATEQLKQAQEYLSAIDKVFNSLSGAIKNTVIQSSSLDKIRRNDAQSYLQSIRGTDLTKAGGLDDALGNLSGDSRKMFATFEEYARDQAKTAELVSGLKEQAGVEKSFAELTIDRLNDTITAIEKQTEDQLAQAQAIYEGEVAVLDKIIENAQAQIDALNGINTSVLSVKEALSAFASSINAATSLGAGGGGGNKGVSTGLGPKGEFIDNFMTSWWENTPQDFLRYDLNGVKRFDVGTNFVPSDMLAMVHEGERIIPAADNSELMRRMSKQDETSDKEDVKALLRELITVTTKGDVANAQQTAEVKRILKKFDQDGLPETRDIEN